MCEPSFPHFAICQVIEKAYKKLRLDALVIQQGRLTDNKEAKVRGEEPSMGGGEREKFPQPPISSCIAPIPSIGFKLPPG